jgi:hypothetical protein
VVVDVVPDRHDQIFHVAKNATTDALLCEFAEKRSTMFSQELWLA